MLEIAFINFYTAQRGKTKTAFLFCFSALQVAEGLLGEYTTNKNNRVWSYGREQQDNYHRLRRWRMR